MGGATIGTGGHVPPPSKGGGNRGQWNLELGLGWKNSAYLVFGVAPRYRLLASAGNVSAAEVTNR